MNDIPVSGERAIAVAIASAFGSIATALGATGNKTAASVAIINFEIALDAGLGHGPFKDALRAALEIHREVIEQLP